jgi:site-specific recombinase XerD
MAATSHSSSLVPVQPVFTDAERLALAGFLAGYRGLTREAYKLDLRQFTGWCRSRSVPLFSVRRADIETFARELEARGRARATVTRRLCTIAGFYKYAVEEELLEHSPAAHVRRPRLDYESHATALDRNELGALLVAAGLGPAAEHALISLLALNGLRVSESLRTLLDTVRAENTRLRAENTALREQAARHLGQQRAQPAPPPPTTPTRPRAEPHVSDMSRTQKPRTTRDSPKRT